MTRTREDSLWHLIVGPTIWAGYFLAVYIAAATRCAKAETILADITAIRLFVAAAGLASLVSIGYAGVRAWRRWRGEGGALPPHGDDTAQSRHQFLALAALLLCGVSFVATVYVALPALFITSCR